MELIDAALVGALISVFLCAVGTAANDASAAMGPAVGSGSLPPRTALWATTALAAVSLVLFSASGPVGLFSDLMPADAFADEVTFSLAIVAALLATGVVMIGLSAFGVVVPSILCLAGAMLGVSLIEDAATATALPAIGLLYLATLGFLVVAALVSSAFFAVLQQQIHFSEKLRVGTREMLGTVAVLAAFLLPVYGMTADLDATPRSATVVGGGIALANWAVGLALGFAAAVVVALAAYLWLHARPTWPDDTIAGAEGAFRRLQNGLAFALAPIAVAAQVSWVVLPATLVMAASRGAAPADWSFGFGQDLAVDAGILVTALLGTAVGILLLGHKPVATVATDVSEIGPVQATSCNLGTLLAFMVGRLLGFPGVGGLPTMAAVAGVGLVRGRHRLRSRALLLSLGGVFGAPIAATLLAILFAGLFRLLV